MPCNGSLLPSVPCKHPICSAASAEPCVRPPHEPDRGNWPSSGFMWGGEGGWLRSGGFPPLWPHKGLCQHGQAGMVQGCRHSTDRGWLKLVLLSWDKTTEGAAPATGRAQGGQQPPRKAPALSHSHGSTSSKTPVNEYMSQEQMVPPG